MQTLLILISAVVVIAQHKPHWDYAHQDQWPSICTTAKSQSPIDFDMASMQQDCEISTVKVDELSKFNNLIIKNNGHTVQVDIPEGVAKPTLSSADWSDEYELHQFHFHWAQNDNQGSEHTVAKLQYPLEAHFVHLKKGVSKDEALKTPKGVAVLSVFFTIGESEKGVNALEPYIARVVKHHQNFTITTVFHPYSILPQKYDAFYRYYGSFTTPDCNEIVIWTVFSQPSVVSRQTLEMFRRVAGDDGRPLVKNYRDTQSLNGREIWLRNQKCAAASFNSCQIAIMLLAIICGVRNIS